LAGLRAVAEPTRLRLLVLCSHAELTVSELTQILGQSQPRVSRHLKLMCDAGLLDRFREGTWAFYRLAQRGPGAELATRLLSLLPPDDPELTLDLERLEGVKRARSEAASSYFRDNAAEWDRIRSLHIDDLEVERVLAERLAGRRVEDYLDIGTGTGRLLELFGGQAQHAVGIDLSREMLAVARANLERAGLRHCSVRQADLYQLPLAGASFDVVTMHQVLHYLENPAAAVAEAARVVRPGGMLVIVDFAPHEREELREQHAHRRLGFRETEVAGWCAQAGLVPDQATLLPGNDLTVTIWSACRATDSMPTQTARRSETVR
jgi:ArsR family transcriptional regulator